MIIGKFNTIFYLFLKGHILLLPLFTPTIGGVRTAHEYYSNAPQWNQIIRSGELQQPDGVLLKIKFDY